jgi:hypothetical protein
MEKVRSILDKYITDDRSYTVDIHFFLFRFNGPLGLGLWLERMRGRKKGREARAVDAELYLGITYL